MGLWWVCEGDMRRDGERRGQQRWRETGRETESWRDRGRHGESGRGGERKGDRGRDRERWKEGDGKRGRGRERCKGRERRERGRERERQRQEPHWAPKAAPLTWAPIPSLLLQGEGSTLTGHQVGHLEQHLGSLGGHLVLRGWQGVQGGTWHPAHPSCVFCLVN